MTPHYPQSNQEVESSNKIIISSLKKRLEAAKERWVKEFPGMLWVDHTTPKASTGESPFSLVYGIEVVTPMEVISQMLRARDESQNFEAMTLSLDLLEEKREQALIWIFYYHNQIAKCYNKKVQ